MVDTNLYYIKHKQLRRNGERLYLYLGRDNFYDIAPAWQCMGAKQFHFSPYDIGRLEAKGIIDLETAWELEVAKRETGL